jgi:hypothetical protein
MELYDYCVEEWSGEGRGSEREETYKARCNLSTGIHCLNVSQEPAAEFE